MTVAAFIPVGSSPTALATNSGALTEGGTKGAGDAWRQMLDSLGVDPNQHAVSCGSRGREPGQPGTSAVQLSDRARTPGRASGHPAAVERSLKRPESEDSNRRRGTAGQMRDRKSSAAPESVHGSIGSSTPGNTGTAPAAASSFPVQGSANIGFREAAVESRKSGFAFSLATRSPGDGEAVGDPGGHPVLAAAGSDSEGGMPDRSGLGSGKAAPASGISHQSLSDKGSIDGVQNGLAGSTAAGDEGSSNQAAIPAGADTSGPDQGTPVSLKPGQLKTGSLERGKPMVAGMHREAEGGASSIEAQTPSAGAAAGTASSPGFNDQTALESLPHRVSSGPASSVAAKRMGVSEGRLSGTPGRTGAAAARSPDSVTDLPARTQPLEAPTGSGGWAHGMQGNLGGQAGAGPAAPAIAGSREAFAELDGSSASPAWVHAGSRQAEAGFEDPALGWVGVRAGVAGGQVHASVVPGTPEAAAVLDGHLSGLNSYLEGQHLHVASVTVASPEGHGGQAGSGQSGNPGTQQEDGQGTRQETEHGSRQDSEPAMSVSNSAGGPVSGPANLAEQALNSNSNRVPGLAAAPGSGGHISVMA